MKNSSSYHLGSELLLNKGEEAFLSLKRVKLLENIAVYGSISKAAKASGITYKTAWAWVEKMNDLSIKPLVQKISGGKDGGGTIVTAYAKELIMRYEEIEALHQKHLHTMESSLEQLEDSSESKAFSFSRLDARVVKIRQNEKGISLELELACGSIVTAQAPLSFLDVYALKIGSLIAVLIESEAVTLSRSEKREISSRNQLKTRVEEILVDGDDVLLTLSLCEGQSLTSRITYKSYKDMKIQKGDELMAMFKAYSVTLFCKGETR